MSVPQVQVGTLLRQEKPDQMYVSFEFFPPRTEAGDKSLLAHIDEFKKQEPIFVDFTWGAGGSTSEKTCDLCKITKDEHGLNVNMHLTCTNMPSGKVDEALAFCKKNDIRNIVALRGDPPAGQEWHASKDGFENALDLVKYIRKNHGDYFSIAVAGYPEGHPNVICNTRGTCDEEGMKAEYEYLKAKVDAGAECIITQLFYDVDIFLAFVKRCREIGITCPILPGMLPMVSYAGLQRMVSLCKTYMPAAVKAKTEELKDDEAAFKQYGIDLCTEMCKTMMKAGINHFHFYTLNQTHSTLEVLKNLGIYKQTQ